MSTGQTKEPGKSSRVCRDRNPGTGHVFRARQADRHALIAGRKEPPLQASPLQIQPTPSVSRAAHGAARFAGRASTALTTVTGRAVSTLRRGTAASEMSTRTEQTGRIRSVRSVGRMVVQFGRSFMTTPAERRFARDEVHRDQIDGGRFGRFRV